MKILETRKLINMRIGTIKETLMKKCSIKKNNQKILSKKEILKNIAIKIINLLTHQGINTIKITKNHICKARINTFQMKLNPKTNTKFHIPALQMKETINN